MSGLNAAPTKTIVPPQMIRPHIMPPPPLFGFKPVAEAPVAETPAADHPIAVENSALESDFKLLWYDDTENTKVVSDELLVAPPPVLEPDPTQPELFNEAQPSVGTASAFEVPPDAEAPSAFGETGPRLSGEVLPPTVAVEAHGSPMAMGADSLKQVAPAELLPEPPASEQVAAEAASSESASGSPLSAVESGLISSEAIPPGGPVAPEVSTPAAAETEIESATVQVAEVIPPLEEDWLARQAAGSAEADTKPPEPEPAPETGKAATIEELPAAIAGEVEAVAPNIPPPPLPLLPLPRLEPSFGLSEVIPPPALQLKRLDQDALQAIFMTDETLDLPKISRLAATLPGVYACVIATRDQAITGGNLPEGFDLAALLGLAPRIREAASRMPIGALKHFTIYGESYSISFFERRGLSLCAIHRARSFVPGVREKLVAIADELSQM
jgi:hypothetical protein